MNTHSAITKKLQALRPDYLDVVNESYMHNVPEGSESHFKVTVVSGEFEGKMLLARHRMVNQCLSEELSGTVHALAIHTMTPDEWFDKSGQSNDSPLCLGGEKS
ncbi:MAG: BolA/IbaG family iron-sulfur metabolism protein [Gammaproteobacteria bacterium]|nr:BolA/IbaG family iron-sulfur metabolism protein [Gammaproteobacteria bacterium]